MYRNLFGGGLVFFLMGWTDLAGKATALMVGTTVCIAASIAGRPDSRLV